MDLGNIASKIAGMPKVQEFLKSTVFPIGKSQLVDKARQSGVEDNIMSMLQRLPDKEYQSQSEVTDELSKM